jgi:hypothetical protein
MSTALDLAAVSRAVNLELMIDVRTKKKAVFVPVGS